MSVGVERIFIECKTGLIYEVVRVRISLRDIHPLRSWLKCEVLEGVRVPDSPLEEGNIRRWRRRGWIGISAVMRDVRRRGSEV